MRDFATLKKLVSFDEDFLQNVFAILRVSEDSPGGPISRWPMFANNFIPARHKNSLALTVAPQKIVVSGPPQISSLGKITGNFSGPEA